MPGGNSRRIVAVTLTAIIAAGILARFPFLGWRCDDAMITYRYAQNLAHGHGFVYNPGERVLGTSTPLFAFLLSIPAIIGIPLPEAADWINVAAQLVTCLFGYAILARQCGRVAGVGAALLLAFAPDALMNGGMGMETPVYVMLLLGCFAWYLSGRRRLCWAGCGLLALIRPEGFLLPLILAADSLMRGREGRRRLRGLHWGAAIAAAWCLFGFLYFGSPLPVSMRAKLTMYASAPTSFGHRMSYFFTFDAPPVHLWALPFFLIAAADIIRRRNEMMPLLAWGAAYSLPVFLIRTHIFPWYYTPAITIYLLVAVLGVSLSVRWLWNLFAGRRGAQATAAAISILLLMLAARGWAVAVVKRHEALVAMYRKYAAPNIRAGEWLRDHTHPSAVVCAGDIGYLGFISGRRILDYMGLVSPEAIGFNECGDALGLLKRHRPEYVAGRDYRIARRLIVNDPWFRRSYEPAATIRMKNTLNWYIFRRNDDDERNRGRGLSLER